MAYRLAASNSCQPCTPSDLKWFRPFATIVMAVASTSSLEDHRDLATALANDFDAPTRPIVRLQRKAVWQTEYRFHEQAGTCRRKIFDDAAQPRAGFQQDNGANISLLTLDAALSIYIRFCGDHYLALGLGSQSTPFVPYYLHEPNLTL
jgi:hypothetical protein